MTMDPMLSRTGARPTVVVDTPVPTANADGRPLGRWVEFDNGFPQIRGNRDVLEKEAQDDHISFLHDDTHPDTTPRNRRRRRESRPVRLRDDDDDTCQLPRFPPTTSPILTRNHGRRRNRTCAMRSACLVPKSALCAAVTVTEWQIVGPRTGGREPAERDLACGYRSDEIATSPARRPRILSHLEAWSVKAKQHGEIHGGGQGTRW